MIPELANLGGLFLFAAIAVPLCVLAYYKVTLRKT